MVDGLDWLDDDEVVLEQARALVLVHELGSGVRRRARGRSFLTDRRLVVRHGRRGGTTFVDVARDQIRTSRPIPALRVRSSYHRPFPGRRVLRLDVQLPDRSVVIGIVLPTAEAAAWHEEIRPADTNKIAIDRNR